MASVARQAKDNMIRRYVIKASVARQAKDNMKSRTQGFLGLGRRSRRPKDQPDLPIGR
jgi:hypothetical protein